MSDLIPEGWKTDNLFLLIGGNPLPNYVAIYLLLNDQGVLHLVYSPDTIGIAQKLSGYFAGSSKMHSIHDPADSKEINRVINDALQNHCKPGSIGLHYTGGTKAMAVHVHQVVNKKRNGIVCTYLDSRTKTLRRDGQEPRPKIQCHVKPTISTLFNLHDIDLLRELPEEDPQPVFPQIEKALAEAHTTSEGIAAYDHWCRRYLRVQEKKNALDNRQTLEQLLQLLKNTTENNFHERALVELRTSKICQNELVEKVSQFSMNPIPFPQHPKLAGVTNAMRQVFSVNVDTFCPQSVVDTIKGQGQIRKLKHLVAYLDGKWIEYWTLAAFLANKKKHKLQSLGVSLETQARLTFEFDVAAMQGYQLYAVSCTRSDDKGLCKSKLFEAFTHATQIGGDEARVGLVCTYSNAGILQKQVAEVWRTCNNRMRVFGPSDLSKLPEKFAEWLGT